MELSERTLESLYSSLPSVEELQYVHASFLGLDAKSFRVLSDKAIQRIGSGLVVLFNEEDDKVQVICKVTQDWIDRGVDASKVVQELAPLVGGRGGGRKNMAQAGGTDPKKIPEAMKQVPQVLSSFFS